MWSQVASVYDVLENPVWGVAAPVIAVVSILVTLFLFRRSRSRKAIVYRVTDTALVSVKSEARDKVAITYDGNPVSGVHLIEFAMRNEGNVPIQTSDFDRPVTLELGQSAVTLTTEVVESDPPGLNPEVVADRTQITVAPLLLNPGDRFRITALVRDYVGPVVVGARIVGVSSLADANERDLGRQRLMKRGSPVREWTVAVLGAALTVAALTGVIDLFRDTKDHTTILVRGGKELCGSVLEVGDQQIVLKLKDDRVRTFPVADVLAMRDNDC